MVGEVCSLSLRSLDKIMVMVVLNFEETVNHFFNKMNLNKASVIHIVFNQLSVGFFSKPSKIFILNKVDIFFYQKIQNMFLLSTSQVS